MSVKRPRKTDAPPPPDVSADLPATAQTVSAPATAAARPDSGADSRNQVNALAKGLRVLEAFTAERREMTLSEVGAAADLDPGTTHRMLNTLVRAGYVAKVEGSRRFRLTLKVMDLGLNAIARTDIRDVSRPILRSLVGALSEAASLGVLDGGDVVYIERVRAGVTRIGIDIRIGTTIPAASSAIGIAILAFLPPNELERILATPPRPGGIPPVPVPRRAVDALLAQTRADGFALMDSIYNSGMRVIAVPVFDADGHPLAAISVAAPAALVSAQEVRAQFLEPVRAAAAEITGALRASGSIIFAP